MTFAPLNVAHRAIRRVIGAEYCALPSDIQHFNLECTYPMPNKHCEPISFEMYAEWIPRGKTLSVSVSLNEMSFKAWEENIMYEFFSALTRNMRPFILMPESLRQACYCIPVMKEVGQNLWIPAFAAQIACERIEEDGLEVLVEQLTQQATRALYYAKGIFSLMCRGTLLNQKEQLRQMCVESQRFKMCILDHDDEDPQPTKETHPRLFN